jgi:hypothetical protein
LADSKDLKAGLRAQGLKIPNSRQLLKKEAFAYGAKIMEEKKKDILKLRDQEDMFSVSLDEWTSSRNRRFMNVNLHTSDPEKIFGLGMIRVRGKMPHQAALRLLKKKILQFDLDTDKDIFWCSDRWGICNEKHGKKIW